MHLDPLTLNYISRSIDFVNFYVEVCFFCISDSCKCESLHSKKVQVGKDQEKAQSEKDSHSKNRGGKKTKLTIRYLYHETYRKPNEQLFSQ